MALHDVARPTYRPLGAVVGVEVLGVDASREIDTQTAEELRSAAARYGVLLFRDQHLTSDDQRRFTRYFGELVGGYVGDTNRPRAGNRVGRTDRKDIAYVGNAAVDGEEGIIPQGELEFHADGLYTERPARGTLLFAIEIPTVGGNTLFASTAHAYETLPAPLQERLLDLDVLFNFDYTTTVRTTKLPDDAPHYVHPLVLTHPHSGRPLLNCNRLLADHIVGMQPDESANLIRELCDHIEVRENVYEHVWRVGDLLFWDNLATVHARTDFDPTQRRWLRRTTIAGEKPQAYRDRIRNRQSAIVRPFRNES